MFGSEVIGRKRAHCSHAIHSSRNRPVPAWPSIDEHQSDLSARAKFKEGDKVYWHAVAYKVSARYWRRSGDTFYHRLREINTPRTHPDMPKKVPENELEAG